MRHPYIISSLLMATVIIASCSKQQERETVTASFTLSAATATKAAADGDGDASAVNRYILEVYRDDNGAFYDRIEKSVAAGTMETEMKVDLVIGEDYSFVFWADCADADGGDLFYDTHSEGSHGLRGVTLASAYSGNDNARDAFSASVTGTAHKAFNTKITLTRPFAQVNIITDDLEDLAVERLAPSSIKLGIDAYSSFNALEGTASGRPVHLEYSAQPYYLISGADGKARTLSMDYLFASPEKEILTEMVLETVSDGRSIVKTFNNVPYRRNWRTRIHGSILTAEGSWDVSINPEFSLPEQNQ